MVNYTGYPLCEDGDVLIVLCGSIQYQLHSDILKRHCAFFIKELFSNPGIEMNDRTKKGSNTIRWRFDLQHNNGLERVSLDADGNPTSANTASSSFSAGRLQNPVFDCYRQVIDAIYGRPLALQADSMGDLMMQVTGIIDYAEYLGCCHTVTRTLDSMMLEYGQVLWQAIANDPISWTDFALRMNSMSLTKEIAIHIVGKWKSLTAEQREKIPHKLRDLCQSKCVELEKLKQEVEMNCINYRLEKVKRDAHGNLSTMTRASYSNDIMDWLAADIMHQWLAASACQGNNRLAKDGGFAFYSVIAAGEEAYLDKEELQEWHRACPMSTRGASNLRRHLKEFKEELKPIVSPLMQQNANLDTHRHKIDWLTCATFSRPEIAGLWATGQTLDWDRPLEAPQKSVARGKPDMAVPAQPASKPPKRKLEEPREITTPAKKPIAKKPVPKKPTPKKPAPKKRAKLIATNEATDDTHQLD